MKPVVAVPLLLWSFPALATQSPEVSIERFYSLPHLVGTAPSGVTWSKDGRKLAFLWNDSGYDFKDVFLLDLSDPANRIPVRITNLSGASGPREGDPGVTGVRFDPDGTRLLFELGEELFLWTPGGEPVRIASGATGRFSADGLHLAFLRRGNLYVRELGTQAEPRLLAGDPRVEIYVESFDWAPDGRSIAFVEVDERRVPLRGIPDYLQPEVELVPLRRPFPGEEPASRRLGVVGLDSGAHPRFVALGGEPVDPVFSYRWSADGRLLVDTSDLYVKSRRLLVVEPWSGAVREIVREDDAGNVSANWQAEWGPDGTRIYFLSDREDDYQIYSVDAMGGTPRRITNGDFAVNELVVAPQSIVFVANSPRPEERQVFRVGLEGGEPIRITREAGTHEPTVSPDGTYLADVFSSDSTPPDLFLGSVDAATDTEIRLTHSPLAAFDRYTWASPEYVTFTSDRDGATLHGRLLVPPGLDRAIKHPAILGSIYSNTVRNQWGGRNAHPLWGLERVLLERGYLLFNLDIRGSWGHGKAFRQAIRLDYGGIDVEDIASGRKYLASLPFVDPERVGIWGSSYGGLLTTMSLFKKPGLFRAGVAGAPATNVFHALTGEMRVMGSPQDHPNEYQAASPYFHAEGLRDPLLILHGMRDRIVLYKDSVALVEKLIGLGNNVDFVTLPEAEHGWDLGDLDQTRFAYHKLIEFFDRHLQEANHD